MYHTEDKNVLANGLRLLAGENVPGGGHATGLLVWPIRDMLRPLPLYRYTEQGIKPHG
jgi:hypothetical protein